MNRQALELQGDELRNTVAQLREQTAIWQEDQVARQNKELSEQLNLELDVIARRIAEIQNVKMELRAPDGTDEIRLYLFGGPNSVRRTAIEAMLEGENYDGILKHAAERARKFADADWPPNFLSLHSSEIEGSCALLIYDIGRIMKQARAKQLSQILLRIRETSLDEIYTHLSSCRDKVRKWPAAD